MKDWKGNEIKVGDTVCVYQFENMFAGGKMQAFMITESGCEEIGEPFEVKRHQYWDLMQCFLITEPTTDGTFIMLMGSGSLENPIECTFNSLGWNISAQPYLAVCIKGISDNELEHFLYFKNISNENTNQEKSS